MPFSVVFLNEPEIITCAPPLSTTSLCWATEGDVLPSDKAVFRNCGQRLGCEGSPDNTFANDAERENVSTEI